MYCIILRLFVVHNTSTRSLIGICDCAADVTEIRRETTGMISISNLYIDPLFKTNYTASWREILSRLFRCHLCIDLLSVPSREDGVKRL